jgi:Cu(I)/Ag(I) efflux system membrane fusion protein
VIDAFPGRRFQGRVGLVHPHMETATRTVRVRFELDNPDHLVRPGMYATVSLKTPVLETEPFRSQLAAASGDTEVAKQEICPVTGAQLGSMGQPVRAAAEGRSVLLCCAGCQDKFAARPDHYIKRLSTVSADGVLAVPEQAVIDTGSTQVVYVEREPGLFEGVAVTLGPLCEGYYPVIAGLLPGDRVAAAGAFLVDAETRLNPAAAAAYFGASGTPSRGGSTSAPAATRADGDDARASSPQASDKVQANLAKLPEADRKLAVAQGVCPISGLPLGSMGVPETMTVQGRVLFVCCEGCRDQVNQDPQAALSRLGDGEKK